MWRAELNGGTTPARDPGLERIALNSITHTVNRFERRWTARSAQMLEGGNV
jgi:hypothetical protein